MPISEEALKVSNTNILGSVELEYETHLTYFYDGKFTVFIYENKDSNNV